MESQRSGFCRAVNSSQQKFIIEDLACMQPHSIFLGGRLELEEHFMGSCLNYCAYSKVRGAKMLVFLDFLGEKREGQRTNLGRLPPGPLWLRGRRTRTMTDNSMWSYEREAGRLPYSSKQNSNHKTDREKWRHHQRNLSVLTEKWRKKKLRKLRGQIVYYRHQTSPHNSLSGEWTLWDW